MGGCGRSGRRRVHGGFDVLLLVYRMPAWGAPTTPTPMGVHVVL